MATNQRTTQADLRHSRRCDRHQDHHRIRPLCWGDRSLRGRHQGGWSICRRL